MTDFTDRRLEIWAVAREGSPHSPFRVVVRYDWSDPGVVRWTELETNHDPGGGSMTIEPAGTGGSRLHVEWSTRPGRLRHKIVISLLHHRMNGVIARMWRTNLDQLAPQQTRR